MTAKALENTPSTLCEKCSVLSIDQDTIEIGVDSYGFLDLKYDRTDILPNLPLLKASAAAGCAFCAALRHATLDKHITFSGIIRYNLSYDVDTKAVGASARYGIRRLIVWVDKENSTGGLLKLLFFHPDYDGMRQSS